MVIGTSPRRVDAIEKVTGAAEFTADIRLPGMLEAVAVRSDRAHAEIVDVEAARARQIPGCVAVLTAADLSGLDYRFGHIVADQPILADRKVRYFGEPVALVVGEDLPAAQEAAAHVDVRYRDIRPVMSVSEALAPDAPLVHEESYSLDAAGAATPMVGGDGSGRAGVRNVLHQAGLDWGEDVEAALAASHLVVETHTHYPMLFAAALEPYSAIAHFNGDVLEVVSPCQHPFTVVRELARIFSLPLSRVRVRAPYIGGAFGSKAYTKLEPLAAVAALRTGRPVRLLLTMEESFYTARVDSAEVSVRSGFDADGTLVARDFDIVLDTGAYAENSPLILEKAVNRCFGPYRIPTLRVRAKAVYTTTTPACSLRALGGFQTNLAGETNLDQAAQRLGLDAFALRRRNLVRRGESLLPGRRAMDADLVANLDELEKRLEDPSTTGGLRGIGFGCGAHEGGAHPSSTAQVRMASDGSVLVLSGSTELGQGSRTVLTQVAAQELGLPMEQVRTIQSDTDATPWERSTGASRTTAIVGLSVYRATHDLLGKLRDMAADVMGRPAAGVLTRGDGYVSWDEGRLSYGDVITQWFGPGGGEVVGLGVVRRAGDLLELPTFWELGMLGVDLHIDPDTGAVEVDHLVTIADVGRALNPAGVHGQEVGAALQGLGPALSEELTYDGEQLANSNLVQYTVPRMASAPKRYTTVLVERGDGAGVYGSRGVGEGARIPVGGAVASAIARAAGRWPDRLPMTPERVWRLMRDTD